MKPNALRENGRKLKVHPNQPKSTVSQSPPHKRLLKKIENPQKENLNSNNDHSFQDSSLNKNVKEDFRAEIERRYQKTIFNKIYVYPRQKKKAFVHSVDNESLNSSILSMKHVTVYDLNSQNKKRKGATNIPNRYSNIENKQKPDKKIEDLRYNPDALRTEEEEDGISLEMKIGDKNSETYKKILQLLEKHNFLAHNIPKENSSPPNPLIMQNVTKGGEIDKRQDKNISNVPNNNIYSNSVTGNNSEINGISNIERSNLHLNIKQKNLNIHDGQMSNSRSINSKSLPKEGTPNNIRRNLIAEQANRMENIPKIEKTINNNLGKG